MSSKIKLFLASVCGFAALAACQSNNTVGCPEGFVETNNIGMGDTIICCPFGTIGQNGYCVDQPNSFEPTPNDFVEPNTVVADGLAPQNEEVQSEQTTQIPANESMQEQTEEEIIKEPVIEQTEEKEVEATVDTDDFIYLTAPNGKGSAYCPKKANSLAWNGVQYKCCGYGLNSVVVPSRDDSLCCPVGSVSARWIGEKGFDYECCPKGTIEVKNEGVGDKYICCAEHEVGKNGICVTKAELAKEGKVLLTAPNGKGQAYCPSEANSLAWNADKFQCCGEGMKTTVIPSRGDSICCPDNATQARWIGEKWNDFECCPEGTVETKNTGFGNKYVCCPEGNKALDGECLEVN